MQLVEGGCFWSDGYAEVEVTSFSVWMVALMKAAAVGWAVSTRTYIDRPVGVAAFAPTDPEAPRILRFVLHPKQDPPPATTFSVSARSAMTKRSPFVVARQSRSL
jgi:hypothetical protein